MRTDALNWYANAINVTSRLGVKVTGGHVAALSCSDYADTEKRRFMRRILIENLQHLSSLAAYKGLELFLWEPMPLLREPPCAIDDAKHLLNVYAWLSELASESPVIHLQQTDGKGDRHWPFTEKYNETGIIKPDRVLDAIEKSGAKEVFLALEIIHPFEASETEVLDDLEKSVRYWKDYV